MRVAGGGALLAVVALGAACSSGGGTGTVAGPASTSVSTTAVAEPAPDTRIAFTRQDDPRSGQPELWTGEADGTDLRPVGTQTGYFPAWSPDRTHLLFDFFDEDGHDQIATIRPDGTGLRVLTDSVYNEAPDYSPDGSTIVFARSEVGEDDPGFATELWLMDADGSNQRRLLGPADGGFDDTEGEFSPDGSTIVFVRFDTTTDTSAVHVVGADGTGVRRLTPFDHGVEHPRWSPDGGTVVYNIEVPEDAGDERNGIWTVPVAGGDPSLLLPSDDQRHVFKPDYSPDGTRILFGCFDRRLRSDELCAMDADGTGVEQLTATPAFENHPVWA